MKTPLRRKAKLARKPATTQKRARETNDANTMTLNGHRNIPNLKTTSSFQSKNNTFPMSRLRRQAFSFFNPQIPEQKLHSDNFETIRPSASSPTEKWLGHRFHHMKRPSRSTCIDFRK